MEDIRAPAKVDAGSRAAGTQGANTSINAEASLAHANAELHRLSQQLIQAQELERNRIALELHDDVQQILVGLRMSMESFPQQTVNAAVENAVQTWVALLRKAIDHLHQLTVTLRTPAIGKGGLQSELQAHVNRLKLAPNQRIDLELDPHLGCLPRILSLHVFALSKKHWLMRFTTRTQKCYGSASRPPLKIYG